MKRTSLLNRLADRKLKGAETTVIGKRTPMTEPPRLSGNPRKKLTLHLIGRNAAPVKGAVYGDKLSLRVDGRVVGVGTSKKQHREVSIEIDKISK